MLRNNADRSTAHSSQTNAPTSARPPARRGPSGAWSRFKPAVTDPLDVYGLPSKGETRLHDHKTQESYYAKIVERYLKFCASTGGGDTLEQAFASLNISETPTSKVPSTSSSSSSTPNDPRTILPHRGASSTDRSSDLPNIFLAMRKLREGILGSRRLDLFAQRAYMFIAQTCILCKTWEAYQPALLYLLYKIHPVTPLSTSELTEFVSYHVLDLACRQYELGEAFLVRKEFLLRNRRVDAVLKALVHDDWVRFWRVRRAVDGYQRAVMEFASERMRLHALKCVGRSYMNADKAFVERTGDARWEELVEGGVGWELQESGNVVIRRPKPK